MRHCPAFRFACLVAISKDKNFALEPKCDEIVKDRVVMYNVALKVSFLSGPQSRNQFGAALFGGSRSRIEKVIGTYPYPFFPFISVPLPFMVQVAGVSRPFTGKSGVKKYLALQSWLLLFIFFCGETPIILRNWKDFQSFVLEYL